MVDADLELHPTRLSVEDARVLASALGDGSGTAAIRHRLDALLGWLIRPDAVAWEALNAVLHERGLSREQAMAQAFRLLDACVSVTDQDAPEQVLGLTPEADLEAIKRRYRRLIAVYHPDRHPQDAQDLNARTNRLNQAYRELRRRHAGPARHWPLRSSPSPRGSPRPATAPPTSEHRAVQAARRERSWRTGRGLGDLASRVQRGLVRGMMIGCLVLLVVLVFDQTTTKTPPPDRISTESRALDIQGGMSTPQGLTRTDPATGPAVTGEAASTLPDGERPIGETSAATEGFVISALARPTLVAPSPDSGEGQASDGARPHRSGQGDRSTSGPLPPLLDPGRSIGDAPVQRGRYFESGEADPCAGAQDLLSEFREAYRTRAASRLASLFTPGGGDRETRGRAAIHRLYATWFQETRDQELRFENLSARTSSSGGCRVEVRFALSYGDAAGRVRSQSGEMVLLLARVAGRMQIEQLRY